MGGKRKGKRKEEKKGQKVDETDKINRLSIRGKEKGGKGVEKGWKGTG